MPYGDDALDSGVRDERGGEGWNSEGYDTEESAHGLMQWPCAHIRSALRKIRKTGDVICDDEDVFNVLSAS